MGFLERFAQKSEERRTAQKEYQRWINDNPQIKEKVDELNDEAILCEKKAGIAAVVAVPMTLVSPLTALGFVVESSRQWNKGFKALKRRDKVVQENSPYRES
jgi:hypothetical protein